MYIKISVNNKIATLQNNCLIINGNSDYVIQFTFDAEWNAYDTKTARFVTDTGYTDVVFSGNEVAVPVITDAISVRVGVYAGNLHTTTPAVIFCRRCITDGSGSPVEPTPDVYAQIMERLNNLDGVNPATTDKLGVVKIGDNLKITKDGVLSVDTAEAVEQDNTKPVTSAAVYTAKSNIEALLGNLNDLTTEAKNNLVAAINEAAQSGGGGGSTVELDTTLTQSGKAADAKAVGDALACKQDKLIAGENITIADDGKTISAAGGLTTAQVNALDGMFKVCAFIKDDVSAEYTAFKTAFGITDEPVTPDVTLTSISATYSGGGVPVGTAVSDLTGIVVTAHYSDGTSATVTGYTLSGTIAEGENTITVTYNGLTTTFTVTGVAESTSNIISVTWHGVNQISGSTYELNESANMSISEIINVTGIDSIKVTTTSEAWTQCLMNTYASADSDYLTIDGTAGIQGSAGTYIQANSDSRADNSVFDVSNYNYVSIKIGMYSATTCRQYITVEKVV